jgi:hypothetical protein
MVAMRPLEVVFVTNFSDACFRIIPAVAQLVDDFVLRLSILHAYDPAREGRAAAEDKLHSFFPEADHFGVCRRVLLEGDLVQGVEQLRREGPVDLLVVPSSDALGLPHLQRSSRARLLEECGVSVWTTGRKVLPEKLKRRPRNIACWLDFETGELAQVELAKEYALRLGAKLHLLHVTPDILEGSLQPPSTPLGADEVLEALRARLGGSSPAPEVHVSLGGGRRAMVDLVRRCDADLLFLGRSRAVLPGWLGPKMNPAISGVPCPIVCLGEIALRPALLRRRTEDQPGVAGTRANAA